MKIALAQLNYTVGDLENNKRKIVDAIAKARDRKADLVVFAEYAVSGTPCYDLLKKASFLEACEDAVKEIASHCHGISALVGVPVQDGNRVLSAAAFIQDGWVVRYIGKRQVSSRSEMGFLSTSEGCELIDVNDEPVAVSVGEDILDYTNFGGGGNAVVAVCAHAFYRGVIEKRFNLLANISDELGKPVVFVNQVGGESDFLYDGSSCAYNRKGKMLAVAGSFAEDMVVVDLDDRAETMEAPAQDRTRNTYRAIKMGLRDYFDKNGFTKACLGLSGGIDSAVVLAMAAEVLGPDNVRALIMPSQFSSDHSVNDSVEMAENLGVQYNIVPIKPTYDILHGSLRETLGETPFDLTEENIQARIRMVMLMALSNKHGYIVLNTSNKSEAAVGYGTMYGDDTGSLGIIGDLYKIEVYSLARYINREKTIIPDNIIRKAPSAELRPDQKDSDSLPPYEVLDAILYRFIEKGQEAEEIVNAGFEDETVSRVLEMLKRSEYKRRQSPPPLRLSSCPFSSNFILPLINKYRFQCE